MDSEENENTETIKSKRRSAVFQRQSIVPNNHDLENTAATEEVFHESKKFKSYEKEEKFDLQKYVDNLKEEEKKWREEYKKRKAQVQDLLKRDKSQEQVGQKLDITCLSDSERSFLASKPDYEEFNRNVFQLQAMATKVSYLNMCAEHFHDKTLSKLQKDTDDVVNRIIKLAD